MDWLLGSDRKDAFIYVVSFCKKKTLRQITYMLRKSKGILDNADGVSGLG